MLHIEQAIKNSAKLNSQTLAKGIKSAFVQRLASLRQKYRKPLISAR